MNTRGMKRYMVPAALACLAVLTVALSLLQLNWIRQAASTEMQSVRRNMALNTAEGIQRIRRVFVDYFDLLDPLAPRSELAEITKAYGEEVGVPGLITGAFTVTPGDRRFISSLFGSQAAEDLLTAELINELKVAGDDRFRVLRQANLAFPKGILFDLPEPDRRPGNDRNGSETIDRYNIITTDREILIHGLMIPVLIDSLDTYGLRLSQRGDILYASSSLQPDRIPEIRIPLNNLIHIDSDKRPADEGGPSVPTPPDLGDIGFMVYYRFAVENIPNADFQREVLERSDFVIEVFYPNNSLDRAIRLRTGLNIAISFGILALLFAAALMLFRFSQRIAAQRIREQEFVASVSHELRTPITVIKATAGNLSDGIVLEPERVASYGREISQQSDRLARMVEGILLYSGLGSGRKTEYTSVELEKSVTDIVSSFRTLAEKSGTRFSHVIEGIPVVRTDADAVRLIIENLLMNAFVHGLPEGGGSVVLTIRSGPFNKLRIIVEDDGPRVPRQEQRRVFEPFTRGESSVAEQHPGSGLGLHLIKRIVDLLGGDVHLESPYKRPEGDICSGCRFTVDIVTEEPR